MTVTDIEPVLIRRRERTSTQESERVAELRQMLTDPRWSHEAAEIQKAIAYLTATSVLAA